jgi:hypothetical protein
MIVLLVQSTRVLTPEKIRDASLLRCDAHHITRSDPTGRSHGAQAQARQYAVRTASVSCVSRSAKVLSFWLSALLGMRQLGQHLPQRIAFCDTLGLCLVDQKNSKAGVPLLTAAMSGRMQAPDVSRSSNARYGSR